ncbi:MAG TPA: hypothetical protein VG167_14955 [Verrucomicrobiae bacterium]|nr:hypothetical protein [Verrucomicrobiae bacterium]
MRPKPLLSPDPAEGSPLPAPQQDPASPPTPSPPQSPPPAAKTVLEAKKNERELNLEKTLKERETRVAELEDENRRLKTPPQRPTPANAPEKKAWLKGGLTFFDEGED